VVDNAAAQKPVGAVRLVDLDAAFAALADPTRRAVISALAVQPRRAGELAERVKMSAPALSRHLRVLRRAGIVVEQGTSDDARVRIYRLASDALAPTRTWLDQVEAFWSNQLDAFKAHAERSVKRSPGSPRRSS